MNRFFRKYHRWFALVLSLPLLTTIVSGIAFIIMVEWLHQRQFARFLLGVHTFKIFGLGDMFSLLTGIGSLGLLLTGVYLLGLFGRRRYSPPS